MRKKTNGDTYTRNGKTRPVGAVTRLERLVDSLEAYFNCKTHSPEFAPRWNQLLIDFEKAQDYLEERERTFDQNGEKRKKDKERKEEADLMEDALLPPMVELMGNPVEGEFDSCFAKN